MCATSKDLFRRKQCQIHKGYAHDYINTAKKRNDQIWKKQIRKAIKRDLQKCLRNEDSC